MRVFKVLKHSQGSETGSYSNSEEQSFVLANCLVTEKLLVKYTVSVRNCVEIY